VIGQYIVTEAHGRGGLDTFWLSSWEKKRGRRRSGSQYLFKTLSFGQAQWLMPVIPVTCEVEIRGWHFKASQSKEARPCLENKLKPEWLETWLLW
jgi:hypothetical protein